MPSVRTTHVFRSTIIVDQAVSRIFAVPRWQFRVGPSEDFQRRISFSLFSTIRKIQTVLCLRLCERHCYEDRNDHNAHSNEYCPRMWSCSDSIVSHANETTERQLSRKRLNNNEENSFPINPRMIRIKRDVFTTKKNEENFFFVLINFGNGSKFSHSFCR